MIVRKIFISAIAISLIIATFPMNPINTPGTGNARAEISSHVGHAFIEGLLHYLGIADLKDLVLKRLLKNELDTLFQNDKPQYLFFEGGMSSAKDALIEKIPSPELIYIIDTIRTNRVPDPVHNDSILVEKYRCSEGIFKLLYGLPLIEVYVNARDYRKVYSLTISLLHGFPFNAFLWDNLAKCFKNIEQKEMAIEPSAISAALRIIYRDKIFEERSFALNPIINCPENYSEDRYNLFIIFNPQDIEVMYCLKKIYEKTNRINMAADADKFIEQCLVITQYIPGYNMKSF